MGDTFLNCWITARANWAEKRRVAGKFPATRLFSLCGESFLSRVSCRDRIQCAAAIFRNNG